MNITTMAIAPKLYIKDKISNIAEKISKVTDVANKFEITTTKMVNTNMAKKEKKIMADI